ARHPLDRPPVQRDRVGERGPRLELAAPGQRDPAVAPEEVRLALGRTLLDDQLDVLETFGPPGRQRVDRLHDEVLEPLAIDHGQPRRAASDDNASMTTREGQNAATSLSA